jgi:hypothetical protein
MIVKLYNKLFHKTRWHDLRSTVPVSRVFGLDRGTPIDRYYIDRFLRQHSGVIKGRVLEVSENTYTKKFGSAVTSSEILHYDRSNRKATITGDLTQPTTLPSELFDCFICTQTLNFIFEAGSAIQGIYRLLRKNGVALVTVAGISQISRYDMDRWGDFWRFTSKSASRLFADVFGEDNVKVESFGNVLSTVAFLEGISSEELTTEELDFNDEDYQMLITIVATKTS